MRRSLGYLQGLLLTGVLLYFAFRGTDFNAVWHEMAKASLAGLALAAALQLLSFPLRVLRWQTLLRPVTSRLPFRLMLEATFLGYMVSAVAPGRLGELVRPGLVASRKEVAIGPALGSIVAERLIDTLMMIILLVIGLSVVPITGDLAAHAGLIQRTGLGVAVGVVGATLVLLVLISNQEFLERQAERRGRSVAWLLRTILSVSDGARVFQSPWLLVRVAAESVATWGAILVGFWVGLVAVGVDISFSKVFLLMPIVALGVALPTPAGAGGFHAALVFGLSRFFGVDPSLAASAAVLTHIVSVVPILVIGSALLLTERFAFKDLLEIGREVKKMGVRRKSVEQAT